MRHRKFLTNLVFSLALLSGCLFLCQPPAFANNIGNWSFESELGSCNDGTWDNTNGATRSLGGGFFAAPPDGIYALQMGAGTFTFQVVNHIKPGDMVRFSAVAQATVLGAAGSNGNLKIEFKHVDANGVQSNISEVTLPAAGRVTAANAPAAPGLAYTQFNIEGVAPPQTNRVVFTLTNDGIGGTILYDKAVVAINPASNLTVTSSKTNVRVGEPVAIHTTFNNSSAAALNNTELVVRYPKGFNIDTNTVRSNGKKVDTRDGSLIISLGNIPAAESVVVNLVAVPTTGVSAGKYYDFGFVVRSPTENLADEVFLQLRVVADPMFDEGTIIGKVFNDLDQDGVQDDCEKGVPGVQLATEYGVVVITDENGKYHIPAVTPGRHIVKINGHSLPEGTKFVTEESYLVKITPGIMGKASFAVLIPPDATPQEFQEDLSVFITQGVDTTQPRLDVKMAPEVLKTALERLEKEAAFSFWMNYPDMVKNWFLEIRNELGEVIWSGFGVGAPPGEVTWSGKTDSGFLIKPGVYSYQLKIQDNKGREDWGPLHLFRVVSKTESTPREKTDIMFPEIGDFNLFKDGKRSIPLVAKPTVRIQGKTDPKNKVTVNSYLVTVDPDEGRFDTEMYVNAGEKEFLVEATTPEGETTSYRKTIKVKDSTFFMVALGEEQLGYNIKGADETVGGEESLKQAFYQDGRMSYYLRGKLKGKFLVKSHYDTGDKRNALFTNLDPDHYYPVYGDASKIDYEGQDTLDRFYILVEMDRSFVKWGSFKTEFTDTELSTYNRTLSGLKIHQETVGTTPYGDPRRGFKLFYSETQSRADHNEFAATGGSLYYLRRQKVIEGSEKIRVEVRDKIQGISVQSTDLVEGTDYEIDYEQGRILLSRPLSSVAATDTIVSIDPLDGNQVFLVVDYEYDSGKLDPETDNQGIRAFTHMGDHIRVGGTAIEETRAGGNYEMRGVDLTAKFGRNTKVTAEYAETQKKQTNQAVSYNGGLTFSDFIPYGASPPKDRDNAFLIKAESKPVKNLEVSGYLQGVEGGFSNDYLASQAGTKKYGVTARYKFNDVFYARYRYDWNGLVHKEGFSDAWGSGAPYVNQPTNTAQLVYDDGKYMGQLEYQRRSFDFPDQWHHLPTIDSLYTVNHAIAGKLGYRLNERLKPYIRSQVTMDKNSYQLGGGIEYQIMNNLFARIEEIFGTLGDATIFGLEKVHPNGARTYSNIKMRTGGVGPQTLATAIGGTFPLSPKSRIYTEREYSNYQSVDGYADILGYQGGAGDHWDYDLKLERRHLKNKTFRPLDMVSSYGLTSSNAFNVASGAIGYADKRLRARTMLEGRRDSDSPKLWQWVTRQYLDYKVNQDISFLTKLDYGVSRFYHPSNSPADFMEFSSGFAYRPLASDRLNALTRYTYTRNLGNDVQFYGYEVEGYDLKETAHIIATDVAYDVLPFLQLVEKLGYKLARLETEDAMTTSVNTFLWANRFNYHITRKWDVALEYRLMFQTDAVRNLRQGPLFEVDREFYDYVRLGLGYNFTHFDDDLRKSSNYDAHGPFVRLTGKF